MKNFYIFGVHRNIHFFWGGGWGGSGGLYEKPICRGDCLKREAWAVCRFQGELSKKGGGVFERGVDTPIHSMAFNCQKLCQT